MRWIKTPVAEDQLVLSASAVAPLQPRKQVLGELEQSRKLCVSAHLPSFLRQKIDFFKVLKKARNRLRKDRRSPGRCSTPARGRRAVQEVCRLCLFHHFSVYCELAAENVPTLFCKAELPRIMNLPFPFSSGCYGV